MMQTDLENTVNHYFAYSLLGWYLKRYTSLALWNLSSSYIPPMLSSSGRNVNYNLCNSTMKMDDIKFISLLLLFPLFTEATHGGEYTLNFVYLLFLLLGGILASSTMRVSYQHFGYTFLPKMG